MFGKNEDQTALILWGVNPFEYFAIQAFINLEVVLIFFKLVDVHISFATMLLPVPLFLAAYLLVGLTRYIFQTIQAKRASHENGEEG